MRDSNPRIPFIALKIWVLDVSPLKTKLKEGPDGQVVDLVGQ